MPSIDRGPGWRGIALQALVAMLPSLCWIPAAKAFNPGCTPFPGTATVAFGVSLVLDGASDLDSSIQPLEPDDACSSRGSGKFLELEAFSGKMLDAVVLGTNGDGVVGDQARSSGGVASQGLGKIINDSSGGASPLVERPGGGGRRILWRQIQ